MKLAPDSGASPPVHDDVEDLRTGFSDLVPAMERAIHEARALFAEKQDHAAYNRAWYGLNLLGFTTAEELCRREPQGLAETLRPGEQELAAAAITLVARPGPESPQTPLERAELLARAAALHPPTVVAELGLTEGLPPADRESVWGRHACCHALYAACRWYYRSAEEEYGARRLENGKRLLLQAASYGRAALAAAGLSNDISAMPQADVDLLLSPSNPSCGEIRTVLKFVGKSSLFIGDLDTAEAAFRLLSSPNGTPRSAHSGLRKVAELRGRLRRQERNRERTLREKALELGGGPRSVDRPEWQQRLEDARAAVELPGRKQLDLEQSRHPTALWDAARQFVLGIHAVREGGREAAAAFVQHVRQRQDLWWSAAGAEDAARLTTTVELLRFVRSGPFQNISAVAGALLDRVPGLLDIRAAATAGMEDGPAFIGHCERVLRCLLKHR